MKRKKKRIKRRSSKTVNPMLTRPSQAHYWMRAGIVAGLMTLASPAGAPEQPKPPIEVEVLANGDAILDGELIVGSGVEAKLRELAQQSPRPELHIGPSPSPPYNYEGFVAFITAARKAGFKMGLLLGLSLHHLRADITLSRSILFRIKSGH